MMKNNVVGHLTLKIYSERLLEVADRAATPSTTCSTKLIRCITLNVELIVLTNHPSRENVTWHYLEGVRHNQNSFKQALGEIDKRKLHQHISSDIIKYCLM